MTAALRQQLHEQEGAVVGAYASLCKNSKIDILVARKIKLAKVVQDEFQRLKACCKPFVHGETVTCKFTLY